MFGQVGLSTIFIPDESQQALMGSSALQRPPAGFHAQGYYAGIGAA